ncbi:MAG: c-type cytochrome [Aggregatilineales bacterium]
MRRDCLRKTSFVTVSLLVLMLTACRPAAKETAPTITPFPTYDYVQPSEAPIVLTGAAQTPTTSSAQTLDPDKVALGKSRYVALTCGTCHGDDGKGTDKGASLVGLTLSQDDFITLLRTGGKMGSAHQYSANRLSDTGGEALYFYILSLSQSK